MATKHTGTRIQRDENESNRQCIVWIVLATNTNIYCLAAFGADENDEIAHNGDDGVDVLSECGLGQRMRVASS